MNLTGGLASAFRLIKFVMPILVHHWEIYDRLRGADMVGHPAIKAVLAYSMLQACPPDSRNRSLSCGLGTLAFFLA